jgi:hypothetical protein
MKREQSKLRQSFYARFEEEIKQAEEYGKREDYINGIVTIFKTIIGLRQFSHIINWSL